MYVTYFDLIETPHDCPPPNFIIPMYSKSVNGFHLSKLKGSTLVQNISGFKDKQRQERYSCLYISMP